MPKPVSSLGLFNVKGKMCFLSLQRKALGGFWLCCFALFYSNSSRFVLPVGTFLQCNSEPSFLACSPNNKAASPLEEKSECYFDTKGRMHGTECTGVGAPFSAVEAFRADDVTQHCPLLFINLQQLVSFP